jgi:hypothetical protein
VRFKWTHEKLQQEALKYKTRNEFAKGSPKFYLAARRRKILNEICGHMELVLCYWTLEKLQQEALKYNTKGKFKKYSVSAYSSAWRMGILDKICSHMQKVTTKWTDEMLQEEALKYETRNKFAKNSASAYHAARIRGILNEICKHTTKIYNSWTLDRLQKEALKYTTRAEFKKNNNSAYCTARVKGVLDEICKHMKLSINISSYEKQLFDIIREKFPKTQKLKDRKVKIENKPHIFGFDIDIYIPELRKGIEFDGHYWHSIEGLKRSRTDWPKEDLEKFHEIKDNWFKSKGIVILHIKEEDWIKNKEACISACLDFLI